MLLSSLYVLLALMVTPSLAFFQDFFHQQEPQKPIVFSYVQEFQRADCQLGYTCPLTLACVAHPSECPCPHEGIDVKCPLSGAKEGEYVCARDCAKVRASLKI
ncbi:BQ5605_C020g09127 [Microbotryum silenes-dioicae]|uniref:Long chronological lifespan protein 2 n=1 Tax=Microbotryum silenes-dioicae TaxID=796604 RepID=A0A2X0MNK7_9BASI|nr:BQ5605_C020g09127 [Microbotryum silenes-dioicae]